MALWEETRVGVARIFALAVLAAFLLSTSLLLVNRPAGAADVSALIKQLDRTEWEIVRDEVGKRLPNLIASKEEQALFNELMQSSQDIAGIAQALQYEKYDELGALSARIVQRDLEKMVAGRFGEDSRLYKSVQVVKNNPTLARELARAALNVDPDAAGYAIREALKTHAKDRISELQAQGEKFWKDMLLEVVPGGTRLASFGFNPVDIYLQTVRDFRDFSAATRLRFNNTMLDCLALRYRKIRSEGYNHRAAREEIENFDTGTGMGRNFDCSAERNKFNPASDYRSWAQWFSDFAAKFGRSTAVQGELKLTSGEIVDLIEQYERAGAREKRGDEFSEWLQERLIRKIKARAGGLRAGIDEEQKRVAEERISDAEKVMAAIEAEIARLDRDKSDKQNDAAPRDKDEAQGQPVAGKQDENDGTSGRAADKGGAEDKGEEKEKPEPEKVTVECERFTALVRSAERKAGRASAGESGNLISELNAAEAAARAEGNCGPEVFASAADVRDRLQKISDLRNRLQAAVSSCDVEALSSLRSEASRLGSAAFLNEVTLLQTAQTGVSHFKSGKAAFDAGSYAEAKEPLQRALSGFKELPSGACQTYADRAQKGLDQIEKVLSQKGIVDRAINTCDVDGLKRLLARYKDRKFRFFRESVARIRAALPECKEKERIIAEGKFCDKARGKLNSARSDFQANRLKAARQTLLALDKELTASNTKRCSDLPGRVRQGLDNLEVLKTEYGRLRRAAKDCDVETLNKLVALYKRKNHLWFKKASSLASSRIDECRDKRPSKVEAIADCRQKAETQGRAYGTTRFKPDGTYTCHFCAKGYVSNGRACVPDRAAAEADCRRQAAANGKVYAKTEIRNDGSSICHWCEPGYSYANGKCWTPAQLANAKCRQDAARRGKVFARADVLNNGQYRCHWCERGQYYVNGRCWSAAALAEARCRQDVARQGKVFGRAVVLPNGQYRCLWCEPSQYYRNGQCYSRAQDIARGAAIISGIINQMQRGGNEQRTPTSRITPNRTRNPTRAPRKSKLPPTCVKDGFINVTDPRCKPYW